MFCPRHNRFRFFSFKVMMSCCPCCPHGRRKRALPGGGKGRKRKPHCRRCHEEGREHGCQGEPIPPKSPRWLCDEHGCLGRGCFSVLSQPSQLSLATRRVTCHHLPSTVPQGLPQIPCQFRGYGLPPKPPKSPSPPPADRVLH